jgi:hypothetical protein
MTFGYNVRAAFEESTAEVIDHTKSLPANLIKKREEPEVHTHTRLRHTPRKREAFDTMTGAGSVLSVLKCYRSFCCKHDIQFSTTISVRLDNSVKRRQSLFIRSLCRGRHVVN